MVEIMFALDLQAAKNYFDQSFDIRLYVIGFESLHNDDEDDDNDASSMMNWLHFKDKHIHSVSTAFID